MGNQVSWKEYGLSSAHMCCQWVFKIPFCLKHASSISNTWLRKDQDAASCCSSHLQNPFRHHNPVVAAQLHVQWIELMIQHPHHHLLGNVVTTGQPLNTSTRGSSYSTENICSTLVLPRLCGLPVFVILDHIRGLTIKFANSPLCACRGSSGQKPQYGLRTMAHQRFTAVLSLIYGSLFLSGVYYCLSVFWCAVTRMSELELEHCLWERF
jgi:hypothetical protein